MATVKCLALTPAALCPRHGTEARQAYGVVTTALPKSHRRFARRSVPGTRQQQRYVTCAVLDAPYGGTLERKPIDLTKAPSLEVPVPEPEEPEPLSGKGAEKEKPGKKTGGGDHRVVLLDDATHNEALVVKVVTSVIPTVTEDKAKEAFELSRQMGRAIICTALLEHAEFYASQIFRLGVRCTIEPDDNTA